MLDDALVEALEARGEECDVLLRGELLDERLVELAAPGARVRRRAPDVRVAVDGLERRRYDVDAQHHAGTATVRRVVDLPRHGAASCPGS